MEYIVLLLAVAIVIATCGCIQAPTDYSPVNEPDATITIINYDKYLNPSMIRDALSMAGMPEFIHVNIIQAPNNTPTLHTSTYWGITTDGPVLPGDSIILVVPYNCCGLFRETQYAGFALDHGGAVVSSGDVWGAKLGMRILHEMEHERGLPADDMEITPEFGKHNELEWHIWLANTHPEAFNT